MKAILYAGVLLLFVALSCGCTTTAPASGNATAASTTPNLLGNWSGTSTGYVGGTGFTDYAGSVMTMRVTDQKGRIFRGQFLFPERSGGTKTVDFGGAIGRDGTTLTIVEREGGYSYGTLVAPTEIELIHADDADPSDVAIDTLKKR